MRMESDDRRFTATTVCNFFQTVQYGVMAQMNSVKCSYGDDRAFCSLKIFNIFMNPQRFMIYFTKLEILTQKQLKESVI